MVFINKEQLPTFKRGEDVGSEQLMQMMEIFRLGCNELSARLDSIRNLSVHEESSIQTFKIIDKVNNNSESILSMKQVLDEDMAAMSKTIAELAALISGYNDRITALDSSKAKRSDLVLLQQELVKCQVYADNLLTAWNNGDLNGATFIPSIDVSGNISWSNNKGLQNPTTRNIKGPKGDKGEGAVYLQGVSAVGLPIGSSPTVTNIGSTTAPNLVFGLPESPGLIPGGATGQIPAKNSNDDYDMKWVSIVNTLTSTSTTDALSAAQGKILSDSIAGKANSTHSHSQSEVTGLSTALAGKANSTHSHSQSDVTGLSTALAGKANSAHSHAQTDITGLSTSLSSKLDKASLSLSGTTLTITI